MPLQATSGAASYDGFGGGAAAVPAYIEDVFSTYLYTGNSTNRSIVNDIDLSGKGGLVWIKDRNTGLNHTLFDTVRGATNYLFSDSSNAQGTAGNTLTAFNSNGFNLGTNSGYANGSGYTYASWTFRKQPKFFDVLTYSGNGTAGRTVSHNLGSTPGFILVKRTDTGGSTGQNWVVWHRSAGGTGYLNSTNELDSSFPNSIFWGDGSSYVAPTSTTFTVTTSQNVNASGGSYVAYLFAHNAGGFGLTGTDNVISCGSYVGDGTTRLINIGYEPQWILIKNATSTAGGSANDWKMIDSIRGFTATNNSAVLEANTSDAEANDNPITIASQGFNTNNMRNTGQTYIYIAIRRGPMKVPTSGTNVFQPVKFISTASRQTVGSLPAVDMFFGRRMGSLTNWGMSPRLTSLFLKPNLTDGEDSGVTGYADSVRFDLQNGSSFISSGSGDEFVTYNLKRAPSFMDVVCYTGTGSATTQTHNLGAVPEMMIIKSRSDAKNWGVYVAALGNGSFLNLNTDSASGSTTTLWNSTSPTSSVFTVGTALTTNESAITYVAYLFATCAGVSKVGSYTGTATTKQIDCGFTAGARFVLIKRTDSTGDWYVWDTARGIIAGNDPYLLLNSTAREVTDTDYIDTYSAGFEISSTAPSAINANGGTYIFLAIA